MKDREYYRVNIRSVMKNRPGGTSFDIVDIEERFMDFDELENWFVDRYGGTPTDRWRAVYMDTAEGSEQVGWCKSYWCKEWDYDQGSYWREDWIETVHVKETNIVDYRRYEDDSCGA